MAIYRKRILRYSGVTVSIEADSAEEADKLYDDWISDDDNAHEFSETLDDHEHEKVYWMKEFNNIDEYNRYPFASDFLITKPKIEPKYDLYFTFKDSPGMAKVFLDCTMEMVIEKLREFNQMYFLKNAMCTSKAYRDAVDHNTCPIHYECERR